MSTLRTLWAGLMAAMALLFATTVWAMPVTYTFSGTARGTYWTGDPGVGNGSRHDFWLRGADIQITLTGDTETVVATPLDQGTRYVQTTFSQATVSAPTIIGPTVELTNPSFQIVASQEGACCGDLPYHKLMLCEESWLSGCMSYENFSSWPASGDILRHSATINDNLWFLAPQFMLTLVDPVSGLPGHLEVWDIVSNTAFASAVPEPSTGALVLVGLGLMVGGIRRRPSRARQHVSSSLGQRPRQGARFPFLA